MHINNYIKIIILQFFFFSLLFNNNINAQSVDFEYNGKCINELVTFTGTSSGITPVSWDWNMGDNTFLNGQDVTHTYTSANYTGFVVVLSVLADDGNTYTKTKYVKISNLPTSSFTFDLYTCSSDSVQFTNLSYSNPYIIRYVWDWGDGTNDTVVFPNNPNLKHKFPGITTYQVQLEVMSADSCVHTSSQAVTILPSPKANFQFTGACVDQNVIFTDASTSNGAGQIAYWDWYFDDPASGINNTSTLQNPEHIFSSPNTYNVKLVVTNFNGCKDSIVKQVVIQPKPAVNFTFTNTCIGEMIKFTPDSTIMNLDSINSFHWNFGDGFTANSSTAFHAYTAAGTYNVTLTVTDIFGCSNDTTIAVSVHDLPIVNFSNSLNSCSGSAVQFQDLTSVSFGHIYKWIWDFGDGTSQTVLFGGNPNVSHIYPNAGNFNVTLTVFTSDSCSNFKTKSITITPNPIANFFYSDTCQGEQVSFQNISQLNGGGAITNYYWNFSDPNSSSNTSTLQNPTHVFSQPGVYPVQLIIVNENGCSDTITKSININPKPEIDFTFDASCAGQDITFSPNDLIVDIASIQSWFWDFHDGTTSNLQVATHSFSTSGPHNVTFTIVDTSGCSNTITKVINLIPKPIVSFTNTNPVCKDSEVSFYTNITSQGIVTLWEWDFGDGTTQTVTTNASPNVTHTYTQHGTFNVTLKVTTQEGCFNTVTNPITVQNNPLANFSYADSCQQSSVLFTDLSQPGSGVLSSWSWNFGDPTSGTGNTSAIANPSHVFSNSGAFDVKLITTNSFGCTDTIVKTINISQLPTVNFSYESGCVNDTTQFNSSNFVNATTTVSYHWDFGDGFNSTQADPVHIYTTQGPFNVVLTITDNKGCTNSIQKSVIANQAPFANFNVSSIKCTGHAISFTDFSNTNSTSTIIKWNWDFGDGNDTIINAPASPNLTHTYQNAATYNVTLTIYTSAGCESEVVKSVIVKASPITNFTFENSCEDVAVQFTDLTELNNGTAITSFQWNFGDPTSGINNTSTNQNPLHVYYTPDSYTVLLKASNVDGCWDTATSQVNINQKPIVDFIYDSLCAGSPTGFYPDSSVMNMAIINSFEWNFGDGTPPIQLINPSHTFLNSGTFNVTLTVTDTAGCTNQITKAILVNPKPIAAFSSTAGCESSLTQFTDMSIVPNNEPIIDWYWDFDDNGATSTLQNPTHSFSVIGTYNVMLIVTSYNGCKDTIVNNVQINRKPVANFTYNNSSCESATVYFQDSSYAIQSQIVSYNWIFGPNNTSQLPNPVFVFPADDSCYNVTLIVTSTNGCTDTTIKNVCVDADFDFNFTASTTCLGDTTFFTSELIAPEGDTLVHYIWDFGDPNSGLNNSSSLANPYHVFSAPTTYTVSLTATNQENCVSKRIKQISILPLPEPAFSYSQGKCDSTVFFTDNSVAATLPIIQWEWDFGDGNTVIINSPQSPNVSHSYASHGLYNVSLTITDQNGCSQINELQNMLVKPCLVAEYQLVDSVVCQNYLLTFDDLSESSAGITEWYWDFGDGTDTTYTTQADVISHAFTTSGLFDVKLVITSNVGGETVQDSIINRYLVNKSPIADFSFEKLCINTPVQFTNLTSPNGTIIESILWTFMLPTDTSSLNNPSFIYSSPGSYEVKLVVVNHIGCVDSVLKTVEINALPNANYSYTPACAGNPLTFTDLSTNTLSPLTNWNWTFYSTDSTNIGTSTEVNPQFVFNQSGDQFATLVVSDSVGCTDTITKKITVNTPPISIFTPIGNFNNIQGQVKMENTSIGAVSYIWDFGNGESSTQTNPVVYYAESGSYIVSLISTSSENCTDTTFMNYEFIIKGLYVPTAFAPTSDKKEIKTFKPVGMSLREYHIYVFDRWGNVLWESDVLDAEGKPKEGWDGNVNGEPVPQGVYTWKVAAVFKDGTTWNAVNVGVTSGMQSERWGTVTLIR